MIDLIMFIVQADPLPRPLRTTRPERSLPSPARVRDDPARCSVAALVIVAIAILGFGGARVLARLGADHGILGSPHGGTSPIVELALAWLLANGAAALTLVTLGARHRPPVSEHRRAATSAPACIDLRTVVDSDGGGPHVAPRQETISWTTSSSSSSTARG